MSKPLLFIALLGIVVTLYASNGFTSGDHQTISVSGIFREFPLNPHNRPPVKNVLADMRTYTPIAEIGSVSMNEKVDSSIESHLDVDTAKIGRDSGQVVTETTSFLTSIFSYSATSSLTTTTTATTTTTSTYTAVTVSTLSSSTTTTLTSTHWLVQTSVITISRTSTTTILLTSLTTAKFTDISTSFYPTATIVQKNTSYTLITSISPTITVTYTQTSVVPRTSAVTSVLATTTTMTITSAITRAFAAASDTRESGLTRQIQLSSEFGDDPDISTFCRTQMARSSMPSTITSLQLPEE